MLELLAWAFNRLAEVALYFADFPRPFLDDLNRWLLVLEQPSRDFLLVVGIAILVRPISRVLQALAGLAGPIALKFGVRMPEVTLVERLDRSGAKSEGYGAQAVKGGIESKARRAVFILPGLGSLVNWFKPFERLIEHTFGVQDVDVYVVHWSRLPGLLGYFSNASAHETAAQIEDLIASTTNQREKSGTPYDDIILIGYSAGALMARKAYLFAKAGFGVDAPGTLGARRQADAPWVSKVSRFVLIAGINCGIDLRTKSLLETGIKLIELLGFGRFVRELCRGSVFVENLRCEWLDFALQESAPKAKQRHKFPIVVQVSGTLDDLLPPDNNRDLAFGAILDEESTLSNNFVNISVCNSSHSTLMDIDPDEVSVAEGSENGIVSLTIRQRRAQVFQDALALSVGAIMQRYTTESFQIADQPAVAAREISHVVIVQHGIRDDGLWAELYRNAIDQMFPDASKFGIARERFPWMPALSFLFDINGRRQRNIRWFADKYVRTRAQYPNAKISVIAHSYGSYVFGFTTQNYLAMRFENAVLAGSVLPRDFDWDTIVKSGRLRRMTNIRGSSDWVVGIFPAFFQFLASRVSFIGQLDFFKLGDAGFAGFNWTDGTMGEVAFAKGSHSAFIEHPTLVEFATAFALQSDQDEPLNAKSVAASRYQSLHNDAESNQSGRLAGVHKVGVAVPTSDRLVSASKLVTLVNRFCWVIWSFGMALLLSACWAVFYNSHILAPTVAVCLFLWALYLVIDSF